MTILAFEFSSDRRSVALARDGVVLSEAVQQTGGRGTSAFALVEKVLSATGIAREAVEAMAVGLGPGSYTGIRAAIAIAQGWHLARGVKLLGVSSAAALAAQAQAEKIFGLVNVVVDAQRGEFYLATWEISQIARKEIEPLKIVSGTTVDTLKLAGEVCVGPEARRVLFPAASMVARLVAEDGRTVSGLLEPIYLREPSFVKAPPSRIIGELA